MQSQVRILKNKEGEDIEVYVTPCNGCSVEMVSPKIFIDKFSESIPFLKTKIEKEGLCLKCTQEKQKNDPNYKILSEEEYSLMKQKIEEKLAKEAIK